MVGRRRLYLEQSHPAKAWPAIDAETIDLARGLHGPHDMAGRRWRLDVSSGVYASFMFGTMSDDPRAV
jgi:hypothetical protein